MPLKLISITLMLSIAGFLEPAETFWKLHGPSDHPSNNLCQAELLPRHSTITALPSEFNEELNISYFNNMSLHIKHVNVVLV
jgi:hypothetical protein